MENDFDRGYYAGYHKRASEEQINKNEILIKRDKRILKLEKALQLCAGYLDLDDAHENYAFEEVRSLLK